MSLLDFFLPPKETDLSEELLPKSNKIKLTDLIIQTKNEFPIYKGFEEKNKELANLTDLAIKGDYASKMRVKSEILRFLSLKHPEITAQNIDDIIKQYHTNYYQNLFLTKEPTNTYDKIVFDYFQKFVLSINSPLSTKFERLATILFQEIYGLGIVDELSDDIININGLWINNRNNIRIQFRGIKRKVHNLSFPDDKAFVNAIKNSIKFDSFLDLSRVNPSVVCSRLNGSRIVAKLPPLSSEANLNIRNFDDSLCNFDKLIELNSLDESIKEFFQYMIKGRLNFSISGQMGTGKTNLLKAILSLYSENVSIMTFEPSNELRLAKLLPDHDIRGSIYSNEHGIEELFELALKEDRDIFIMAEIRSAIEAYFSLHAKLRVGKGSGDTYHSTGFENYMATFSKLLMELGRYQSIHEAEQTIALANDIIVFLDYDVTTGQRFIKNISEIVVNENIISENKLIEYDTKTKTWYSVNKPTDTLIQKMLIEATFTEADLMGLNYLFEKMATKVVA